MTFIKRKINKNEAGAGLFKNCVRFRIVSVIKLSWHFEHVAADISEKTLPSWRTTVNLILCHLWAAVVKLSFDHAISMCITRSLWVQHDLYGYNTISMVWRAAYIFQITSATSSQFICQQIRLFLYFSNIAFSLLKVSAPTKVECSEFEPRALGWKV